MSFAAAHESKRVSQNCHTCRDRSPSRGRFGAARKARFATKGLEHERACLDRFRAQSHALIGPSSTGEFL